MSNEIVRLQERITYLEKAYDDLNEVVVGLNRRVSLLAEQVRRLREETAASRGDQTEGGEVPPHYGSPRFLSPEQIEDLRSSDDGEG